MSEASLMVILAPIIAALIAGVGALWRRSITQRDKQVATEVENARLKAKQESQDEDILQLKEQIKTMQEREAKRDEADVHIFRYMYALEELCRQKGIKLPEPRPQFGRWFQSYQSLTKEGSNG